MAMVVKNIKKANKHSIYSKLNSLTDIWENLLTNYSEITAVIDRYNDFELTYSQLYGMIQDFAIGLQHLGVKKGDHLSLFSENSSKWLITDQAILMCSGVNVVRGSQTPTDELSYILKHSDSIGLIAENLNTITKLLSCADNHPLNFIICLSDEEISSDIKQNHNVYSFKEVLCFSKKQIFNPIQINKDDIATLVYTSGTTGTPKGVMISHGNFLSQLTAMEQALKINPGDKSLNILPTWHIYERSSEYYLLSSGVTMIYTNVSNFKQDMKRYKPDYLAAVPRIWDAIYCGVHTELKKQPVLRQKLVKFLLKHGESHIKARRIIMNRCIDNIKCSFLKKLWAFIKFGLTHPVYNLGKKLVYKKIQTAAGGNLKQGISGGGALAGHLEDFYETIGIDIIVGYGLTESSPVLTFRLADYNLRCSAGKPVCETEIKIMNPENWQEADCCSTGVVMARGPQVMKGYYKNNEATGEILSEDGWLNTGDLGWLTPQNDLILTGRIKDIIVLSNGENIEPQPLEDACLKSPYISQIVIAGQDKNALGALIVLNPESVQNWVKKQSINNASVFDIYNCPQIHKLFKKELSEHIQKRPNFRIFEKVQCFKLIKEPFTVENGLLTRTMKIKKAKVLKKYKHLIEEMFKI